MADAGITCAIELQLIMPKPLVVAQPSPQTRDELGSQQAAAIVKLYNATRLAQAIPATGVQVKAPEKVNAPVKVLTMPRRLQLQ